MTTPYSVEKCGEAVIQQGEKEWTISLYQGNAFLIFVYEYQEDGQNMYQLYNFWADKQHMKNCLGLNQKEGYGGNMFNEAGCKMKKIRINKGKFRYTKELTQALVQAFDDLTIELYSEEDIREVFCDVCAHRIILTQKARAAGTTPRDALTQIMNGVKAPYAV